MINTVGPLQGGGSGSTFTLSWGFTGEALGDLAYRGVSEWERRAIGAPGDVLTVVAGIPTWAAPAGGTPYYAGTGLTLSGGDTFNVDYGIVAGTALEGSQDGNYVHIAGPETITGIKTFDAAPVLGVAIPLNVDTGGGVIPVYQYSSGHEFGGGSAPMMIVGTTSSEMRTGTVVRYVQSTTTHSWYVPTGLKMTLANGLHVGTTVVSRSNGEVGAATGFVQGTGARTASTSLDLQSTAAGALLNRLTTVQRDAIGTPATSLLIFNTTTNRFEYYTGTAWKPITEGGMSIYVAGAAGMGPGGTDPQYATLAAMQAAMVADGANGGSPRVGFFVGTFVENVTLVDGCWLIGLSVGSRAQVISGYVTTAVTSTIAGLANCTVAPPGAASGGFYNQSTDGFYLRFENVDFFGDGTAGNAGVWADGSMLGTDSFIYAINCVCNGIGDNDGLKASGAIEILWNGRILAGTGSAGSTQRAIRLDDLVDLVVTVPHEGNIENSGLTDHIVGSAMLENTSNLSLGKGVRVRAASHYTVGPVYVENSLFQIEDGSTVALGGSHKFQMDANSSFLFNTATTGNVVTFEDYTLDTLYTTRYQTAAGITYDGYTVTRPERVQTITGTATIAASTTLALVIPASAATFTVTMPAPTGWREERRLRVKYTGVTHQQDLTLAAHAALGTDYDAAYNSATFKWNDSYEFAGHDDKWIILSMKTTAAGGSYTLPVFLVGTAGSGPGGSSPPYATLGAAKTAMTAGAHQLAVLMPGTYVENLTIDTLAMSVATWAPHASVDATALVTIEGTITINPDAAGRNIALTGFRVKATGQGVVVSSANAVYVDTTGLRVTAVQEALFVDNTSASTKIVGDNCSFVSTTKEGMLFGGAAHNHDFKSTGVAGPAGGAVRTNDGAKVTFHDGGSIVNPVYANGAASAITIRTGVTHTTGANIPYRVNAGGIISAEGVRLDSSASKLVEDVGTGGFFFYVDLKPSGGVPLSYDSGVVVAPIAFVPGATYQVITATGAISEYADFVFLGSLTKIVASLPNGTNRLPKPVTIYALDAPTIGNAHEVDVTGGGTVNGLSAKPIPAGKAFGAVPAILTNDWYVVWDSTQSGTAPTFAPLLHGLKVTTLADTSEAVIGGGAWIASDHTGATVRLRATGASTDGASDVELRLYRLVAGVWTLITGLNGANDWLTITDAYGENVVSDDIYSQLTDGDILQLRVTPTNAATQAVIYRGTLAVTA